MKYFKLFLYTVLITNFLKKASSLLLGTRARLHGEQLVGLFAVFEIGSKTTYVLIDIIPYDIIVFKNVQDIYDLLSVARPGLSGAAFKRLHCASQKQFPEKYVPMFTDEGATYVDRCDSVVIFRMLKDFANA